MRTRKIGDTEVSSIGLGCMNLSWAYGEPPPREVAEQVLLGALDAGYTHFDTAALYGMGRNELLVGEVLGPHRDKFFLASKCGVTNGERRELNGRPEVIKATCEQSLRNLKTDVIDLYYLHRLDKSVPLEETIGAMADLVAEGKVRMIGLSEVSGETLRKAHAIHPIAALQSEYSPWTRNPELGALDACCELETAFVAFSPVARGFLAGSVNRADELEDKDIRKTMPRFMGEAFLANLKLLDGFKALAAEAGCTPAQLCLAWLLQKDPIITPIPGTSNPDHMHENAAADDIQVPADVIARLERVVNETTVAGHRYAPAARAAIDTEEPAVAA
jgi:aryl-alcohol dehydrogenase-like predicted oxidoreductase